MMHSLLVVSLSMLLAFISLADAAPASLRMLTQNNYLPGVPVLVRVEGYAPDGSRDRETWDVDATLSADGGVTLSTNRITLHNGVGSLLVTFTAGGDFNLTASVGAAQVTRALRSVAGQPVTKIGGTLSGGSSTWSGIVNITNDLVITNHVLTIQSNTLVLLNGVGSGTAGADIIVNANASIQSLGTELHPVTITCSNLFMTNRWGQIRHNSSLASLYRHTFINRAGRAPGEGHTGQAPVIRPDGTTLTFQSCTISDLCETSSGAPGFGTPGKVMFANNSVLTFNDCLLQRVRSGPEIQGTAIVITNSYVMDTRGPDDSDGIYLHAQQPGQIIKLVDSVFALGDDDGIDTLGSTVILENCIFRDWASAVEDAKAISVFDGAMDVRRCLVVDSTVGIAAKSTAGSFARVTINNSTVTGNLTNVLAQFKANAPGPVIDYRITNCVIWGGDPVQSDFAATNFTIRYSNVGEPWAGTGNINSDPDFVNAAAKNFRLQISSPCIDAGNPASAFDADGTIADMGFFPFLSNPDPLIAFGSNWRYFDQSVDPGAAWSAPAYNDSSWSDGPAQLGYGEGDEATVISFGADPGNKPITSYYRREFTVLNPSEFTNLQASILVDDGAVVYLNGQEAYRVNMPGGIIASGTLAISALENSLFNNNISPALLVTGTNILAVEVHQQSGLSSDVSFDFELRGQRGAAGNFAPNVSITAPANGSSFPAPANITINATATDSDGTITTLLIFQNNMLLYETGTGTASFSWNGVPAGNYTLTAVATDDSVINSTSAPVNITVSEPSNTFTNDFITFGSSWKYHDKGSNLLTAWVQLAYDDSTWSNGLAQLGYSEGDEATRVEDNPTPGYNPADGDRFITTYFRKSFNVVNAAAFTNLSLRLLRDDAGVVYLNGTEIYRSPNLPGGEINYLTTTIGLNGENTIDTANFGIPGLLIEGMNILAVEIHQQGPTSSDVSFDFALTGVRPGETNAKPIVSVSSPVAGTIFGTPASFTITANAFDPDGTITNVAFYVNGSKSGDDTSSPFTLTTNNVPVGAYALVAVATDNVGLVTTSSIVNVTVSANVAPPVVFNKTPAPGSVTTLTNIIVTFSKAVTGVNASDLLLNGSPGSGVSGSGSNYMFTFAQQAFGTVSITWASAHGITDLFTPSHAFDTNSAGANWQYQFLDAVAPTITTINPVPNSTVPTLSSIAVTFSESVTGVNASDLLINSTPASGFTGAGAGPYSFTFAAPTQGVVQVSWAGGHGIQDSAGNAFAPAPWSYIVDTNSVGIVISEIMYHPSSENVLEEYIELFNKGAGTIGLSGWRFTKGVDFTFSNVSLPPGGYLVVAANVAAFTSKYPTVTNVVGGWTGVLNNTGEEIELENTAGDEVNSVEYADEGDWAIRQRGFNDQGHRGWTWYNPHDGVGNSLELVNPNADNDRGQNWAASRTINGTPGRVNSVNTNNVAPFILDVTHFPIVPKSTEPILISGRVLDEAAGGMAVNLFWRVDSMAPLPFFNVAMRDDGVNGDAAANDGIYTARLNPQANNSVVEFYVRAMDVQGLVRTWPGPAIGSPDGGAGPTGQVANALFQIDDSVYSTTNSQPLYKLIMTAAENAELGNLACGPTSDALMNTTLITIDGGGVGHHYLTGVRPRGHSSRCAGNLRVNFRSDNRWKGLTAINFNTVNVPAQHLGSVLARRSGIVAPVVYVAQVRVNNVNRLSGPYAVVEEMNQDFADNRYPDDSGGNIYRVLRDFAPGFDYRGTDPAAYMPTYYKQNNISENDWSDLIGMLNVMGTGNTVPFTTENVRNVIHVEQWIRHLAVMNLYGNSETGLNSGFNDDYNMYAGAIDPRFSLIPWDMDSVLGLSSMPSTSSIFTMEGGGGAGAALSRFIRWPDFEPIYYRTLQELLTTTMSQTNFDALIDATLGSYVSVGTINTMKTFMNERRAYVLGQIPALPNMDEPTATVTGTPRSPTPIRNATFTVGGTGVASYRFSLNGAAYGAETPIATLINLSLLPNGSNVLTVIAKGANGVWQATTNATVRGWVVDTSIPAVRLNEVLAQNNTVLNHNGTFPDAIELFNEGSTTADIGGLRLTDDKASPNKFTFPPGTLLAPGSNLVVYANNADGTPGLHLGFGLDVSGDSVHLFSSVASGGAELDSVKFGRQLADRSIGRIGASGEWQLTTPTFGNANALQPLGNQNNLRINEWLTASLSQDDFIELYNANALPVALGGLYFTDNLIGDRARNQIEPLTFIGPGEFVAFIANGNGNGGDELNFSLALEHGEIGLFSADLKAIDSIVYGSQLPDVAQGKCPNGSAAYAKLATPTPGAPNACTSEVLPGGGVVINEVLANNAALEEPDGSKPDWIELYNSSGSAINLSDMSLTDDSAIPRRWIIPNGTILNSLGYLKVRCDAGLPSSSTNTGFGLSANGGTVFLFESIANGSGLRSSIAYGLQAADFSIGRTPNGSTNWVLTIPTLGGNNIAAPLGDPLQLKINEWMADPAAGDDDYFEIFNANPLPVDVSRFYLTDDLSNRTKHQLPLLSFIGVGAEAFQSFDADGNTASGADHVGFSLRAAGEAIGLTTAGNVAIDSISFGPQITGVSQGRLPDGSATIVSFPATPTPGNSNFRPLNNVLINELLSHSDVPLEDAIELYNPTDEPVDISGWYLSDSQDNLLKYRIPSNTTVEPGDYAVFYEYQLNDDLANFPFSFSSAKGDEIYLSQTIAGALTGYRAFATFGAAENGVSFGRFRTSVGDDFTAMSARSFGVDNPATTNEFRSGAGLTNPYPKVGPVVINEIMYHPPGTNDALEFLELRNITAAAVPLYDTNNPVNTWRLRSGIDFNFPPNTTIPAGGYLVVASFDPATDPISLAAFRGAYGSNMTLVGPYLGKLDNAGEAIELRKPDAPQTTPGPDFGLVPYIVADRVVYGALPPWPASPDGTGASLKKFTSTLYGNEPLNWQGGTPNPGALNFVVTSNTPPTLNPIPDRSLHVGSSISFTATASDVDLPGQTLTFTLDAPVPTGASIGFGTGVFNWTPATNQGPATYPITVRVTDSGTPSLSDTKTFNLAVLNLPHVNSVRITNSTVIISWDSFAGRRYRVETTTNLTNAIWTQVGTDIFATGPISSLTVPGGAEAKRFYRVNSFNN